MMMRWVLLTMVLATGSLANADTLKHDPFARPLLAAISTSSTQGANSPTTATTLTEEASWEPKLTAVMVAGKNSLVNVDATILRIGEELDGYRLVQVRDSEAVFIKGKKRIVLRMEIPTKKLGNERGRL